MPDGNDLTGLKIGTRDVGGGLQTISLQAQAPAAAGGATSLSDLIRLKEFQQKQQDRPLRRQLLEAQVSTEELRQQELQQKVYKNGLLNAAMGNYAGATRDIQSLPGTENINVLPHPDVKQRNLGFVLLEDPQTGTAQIVNPYANDIFQANIDIEKDLMKQINQKGIEKTINDEQARIAYAQKLVESKAVGSLQEGLRVASSLQKEAADPRLQAIFSQGGTGLGKGLSDKEIEERAAQFVQSKYQVYESIEGSDTVAPDNPLARDLRPKSTLPVGEVKSIAGGITTMKNLAGKVIPQIFKVAESSAILEGTGLIRGTIQNALQVGNIASEDQVALRSMLDRAAFEEVLRIAGTTFTEGLVDSMRTLLPSEKDSLPIAVTKIMTFSTLVGQGLGDQMNTLDAAGYDVQKTRQLIDGAGFNRLNQAADKIFGSVTEQDKASIVNKIYNSLDSSVLNNPERMDKVIAGMPVALQGVALDALKDRPGASVPAEKGIRSLEQSLDLE